MNYFAHGMRFVDRPYLLAGTAVPDWLRMADPRCRVGPRRAQPFADGSRSISSELSAGVLQHIDDDGWFHRTAAFFEISGRLARCFRECLGSDDGFRAGFLGHITTELILDGVLIERQPERLNEYYDAVASVDPHIIEECVNRMAVRPTSRLAAVIPLFRREQFLRDYSDPARLLFRMNQVLRRIGLEPLPGRARGVLEGGWPLVAEHVGRLLPESLFSIDKPTGDIGVRSGLRQLP